MEAVLYCIREVEQSGETVLVSRQQSALQAYKTGAQLVRRKVEELFAFYECHKQEFHSYGNGYLADVLQKGIPAFFKYYDEKYEPQNTILTLDYPIFLDLSEYEGIDCVDMYVRNLAEEQRFLARFGEDYVRNVLCAYSEDYEELPENIAGIVFGNTIGHLIAGKKLTEQLFGADFQKIYTFFLSCEREGKGRFQVKARELAEAFLLQYYVGMEQMRRYMATGLADICTRIENAAVNEKLDRVFVF